VAETSCIGDELFTDEIRKKGPPKQPLSSLSFYRIIAVGELPPQAFSA